MSVTLPYPTYTAFTPLTVHDNVAHNTPHAGLLSNDVALKSAVDTLQTSVAGISMPSHSIVWITPYLVYNFASTATSAAAGRPPEFVIAAAANTGHIGAWQTVSYPSTSYIPSSGVASILVTAAVQTASWQQAYIRLCSVAGGGGAQLLAAYSMSTSNSDDSASDTNTLEMPFNSSRQLSVYWNWSKSGGSSYYWGWVTVVGYRTST